MPKPKQPDTAPQPDGEQVEHIEIDFRGVTFTVPKHADDWDTDTIETVQRKDNVWDVVRAVLGPDQYVRLQEKFPKWRDFQEFRDVLFTTINREVVGL